MEKAICPVCGKYEFSYDFEICQVCGWEHNSVQEDDPDFWAGPNLGRSLNMYREEWKERLAALENFKSFKVKYLGECDLPELLEGKEYEVIGIEDDYWYRVVNETGEDYMYPGKWFEKLEEN